MTTDAFIQIAPDSGGKRVDNALLSRAGLPIYRQRTESYIEGFPAAMIDAGGRLRTSTLTTLFDGKVVRGELSELWDTKGTGTATPQDGGVLLEVTAGQYLVRQSRTYMPYFSGKSQLCEVTFDRFAPQPGVIKRVGYFSSSAVAPYDADYDGWWVESGSGTVSLVVANAGVEKLRKTVAEWDGAATFTGVDWDDFHVLLVDFLWLGGATLHAAFKNPGAPGFAPAHAFEYAGTAQGPFMRSPHHPIRYEIRSTTEAGALNTICSQVSSEGSVSTYGQSRVLYRAALTAANAVGTIYVVQAVRKRAEFRDVPIRITTVAGATVTANDAGVFMLLRNPTTSAPLVWTQNGQVDQADAGTQTVTNVGRVLEAAHVVQSGDVRPVTDNALAWLSGQIDDTMDVFVLAYMPLTVTQNVNGAIHLMEY
jgi:hypothetical protein